MICFRAVVFHKSTEIRREARREAGGKTRRGAKDDDETREAAAGCGFEEQLFRFRLTITYCRPSISQGRARQGAKPFDLCSQEIPTKFRSECDEYIHQEYLFVHSF